MSISVQCPNGHQLKVKDEYAGKRGRCPKCQAPIQIPALPVDAEEELFDDEFPEEELAPAPPALKPMRAEKADKPKAKPKRTKTASDSGASNKKKFIASAVIVLVLALLGYFLMQGEDAPAPNAVVVENKPAVIGINLAYLPPDTELILAVRPAQLLESQLAQSLLEMAGPQGQQALDGLKEKIGLTLSEIDEVVIAHGNLSQAFDTFKATAPIFPMPGIQAGHDVQEQGEAEAIPDTKIEPLIVAHTKVPVVRETLLSAIPADDISEKEHNGTSYLLVKTPDGPKAGFFPDEKTIVLGSEAGVTAAIDRGPVGPDIRREIHETAVNGQFTLAVIPTKETLKKFRAETEAPTDEEETDPAKKTSQAIDRLFQDHGQSFTLTLQATSQLQLTSLLLTDDAQSAEQLTALVGQSVENAKASYENVKTSVPPAVAPIVDTVVASVATQQHASSVKVGATFPSEFFQQETLSAVPGMLFGMMMAGAMNNQPSEQTGNVSLGDAGLTNLEGMEGMQLGSGLGAQPSATPAAEVKDGEMTKTLFLPSQAPPGVFAPDGKYQTVTLKLTGPQARMATAYGHLQITDATDDKGTKLKLVESLSSTGDDAKQFVHLDRNQMFFGQFNAPKDAIEVHMFLSGPAANAQKLTKLAGSLKLMTGGQQKKISISGLPGKLGQTIDDPGLTEAGLTVQLGKELGKDPFGGSGKTLVVTVKGNTNQLIEIDLVEPSGRSATASTSRGQSGTELVIELGTSKPLDNLRLLMTVAAGQKEADVPFEFTDAALPKK